MRPASSRARPLVAFPRPAWYAWQETFLGRWRSSGGQSSARATFLGSWRSSGGQSSATATFLGRWRSSGGQSSARPTFLGIARVELWRERQLALLIADRAGVGIAADYADWAACCEDAGYWWPRRAANASELIAFSVTDLVHRAGFHWFHGADTGYTDRGVLLSKAANYYDEVALLDVVAMFRATVLAPLAASGFDVGLCVNAMGFPALYPPKPPVGSDDWFSRTTPTYQAAMLLRWFAVLRAAGVDYASWYTSMRSPADLLGSERDWGTFDAMSLRNDCTIPDSSGHGQRSRALIAFPRPAWYAWQAWVTLMAYCTRLDVVHAADGCVIIRLTLFGGITEPLHPDRTFPYAFVKPPDGVTFTDLHLGDGVICGVQTGGELLCWQYEGEYCLDSPGCSFLVVDNVPTGTFSQVWARDDRACAVDTDGCVTCWPGDWGWGEGKRICTDQVEPPIKGGGTDPG